MSQNSGLSISDVKTIFTDEIKGQGGTVRDSFEDASRLFARAVLPRLGEAAPQDRIQAGVALKAATPDLVIYPYIFRQVCSNGAILAHILDGQPVAQSAGLTAFEVETALRSAIQRCCAVEIFAGASQQMRLAGQRQVDLAVSLTPHLSTLPRRLAEQVMDNVLDWLEGTDRSEYGLMNSITALARDMADPQDRWTLEALGGRVGVPALSAAQPTWADIRDAGARLLEAVR